MKKKTALKHFGGTVKLASALGISPQSISQWPQDVPKGRAFQIELLTQGELKAQPTSINRPQA